MYGATEAESDELWRKLRYAPHGPEFLEKARINVRDDGGISLMDESFSIGDLDVVVEEAGDPELTTLRDRFRLNVLKIVTFRKLFEDCHSFEECSVLYHDLMGVQGFRERYLHVGIYNEWIAKCGTVQEVFSVFDEMKVCEVIFDSETMRILDRCPAADYSFCRAIVDKLGDYGSLVSDVCLSAAYEVLISKAGSFEETIGIWDELVYKRVKVCDALFRRWFDRCEENFQYAMVVFRRMQGGQVFLNLLGDFFLIAPRNPL